MNETTRNGHIWLMITDGYKRCRQGKLPSMPSHERRLAHPDKFQQWPTPRYPSYKCSTGWLVGCCMNSAVEIRRNWGPRLGSGRNESIVSESGTEGMLSIGHFFWCLFSSLLHTSLLLWISACYERRRHGFYHLPISVAGRWRFPGHRIHRRAIVQSWSVAGLFTLYEYVRGMVVEWFPLLSLSLIRFMQPGRSAPEEVDNAMAALDPSWVMAILSSQPATSLRSLVIILPIYIYT